MKISLVVSHQILLFFPGLSRKLDISVPQRKISFWNSLCDHKHLRQKYCMLPEKCKHKSCSMETTEYPCLLQALPGTKLLLWMYCQHTN